MELGKITAQLQEAIAPPVSYCLSPLWAKNRSSDGTFSSKRFGTY